MTTAARRRLLLAALAAATPFLAPMPQERAVPPAQGTIAFEENRGQVDSGAAFFGRADGYDVLVDSTSAIIRLTSLDGAPPAAIRVTPLGSSEPVGLNGADALPGTISYLPGPDRSTWISNVPTFASIVRDVDTRGVGLAYRGAGRRLTLELTVPVGVDPDSVGFRVEGADDLAIDSATGDLLVTMRGGALRLARPSVRTGASQRGAPDVATWVRRGAGEVGLLVPTAGGEGSFVVSTRLSAAVSSRSRAVETVRIATDAAGNAYVTGPVADAGERFGSFVTKIAGDGATRLFTTYLGSGMAPRAIAVDGAGRAVITGGIAGDGRPDSDAFVAQLAPDGGSLVYSARFGADGDDEGRAIDLASDGTAWIAGRTSGSGFPAGSTAAQQRPGGGVDAFVAHIGLDGGLLASSLLGGSGDDVAEAIRVAGDGGLVVAGTTGSADFPLMHPFLPAAGVVSRDAFVARFDAQADALVFSSRLGGSADDAAAGVAIDQSGEIRVSGTTSSSDLAPAVSTGSGPLFVAIISSDGRTLTRVARLDNPAATSAAPFAADVTGAAWVAADGVTMKLAADGRVLDRVTAPGARDGALVTGLALTRRGGAALAGVADVADAGRRASLEAAGALPLETSPSGGTVFAALGSRGPDAPDAAGCPGTIHFTNGAGTGLWQTAGNWDLGRLPNGTDDVCIPATFDVTLSSGTQSINTLWVDSPSTLTVSVGAVLSLAATSQVNGGLSLATNGTISGAGDLITNGTLSWNGGTVTGAAALVANGGIQFAGTASHDITASRAVTTNGLNTTWTGTGSIRIGTGGSLTNNGTFDCQGDATVASLNTPGPITNSATGTIKKSAGSGTTGINITFNNLGIASVQSGTLAFGGGGTGSGSFTGTASTTLQFTAAYTLASSSIVSADGVSFTSGVVGISGAYSAASTTINGGTASFDSPSPDLTTTLTFTGGTLQGTGTLSVSGSTSWSGGTMTGAGIVNANGGATISGAGVHDVTASRVFNTAGTTTWSGTGPVRVGTSGTITNNGTWDCQADGTIQALATPGPFTNPGGSTFKKSAGAGTTTVGVPFNGAGAITIESGAISFNGGGSVTGAVSGSPSTTLKFGGGTFNLGAASSVSAASVEFDAGTVNVDGTYAAATGTTVSGAIANFDPSCVLNNIGSSLTISSGTANFSSGETVAPTTFTMSAGTLQGGDTVNVSGASSWTGGTMTGAGTVNTNGGLSVSGAAVHDITASRLLNASGTSTWTGTGPIRLSTGGAITNNGTWDCQSDATIQALATPGPFRNVPLSLFKKSAGSGTTTVGVPFNVERDGGGNPATLNVQTGTVSLSNGGTGNGVFTGAAGTSLQFAGGTYTLGMLSSVSADSVSFTAGTINVDGAYAAVAGTTSGSATVNFDPTCTLTNIGSALAISSGTVTFASGETVAPVTLNMSGGTLQGGDLVNVSGLTTWSGGTMTGASTVNANGGLAITGTQTHDLTSSRLLNTFGTTTWSGTGPFRVGTGGAITNNGTWDIQGDVTLLNLGTAGAFRNVPLSLFKKSAGPGTFSMGIPFNVERSGGNTATFNLQSGTFSLSGGGTGSGVFTASPGTTVQFFAGTYTLDGTSTFSADNVSVSGTLIVDGAYAVTTGTTITGGGVTFDPASTLTSIGASLNISGGTSTFNSGETVVPTTFTLSGGVLQGTDTINVSGVTSWSGGTMTGAGTVNTNGGLTVSTVGTHDLTSSRLLNTTGPTSWTGTGPLRVGSGAAITNTGIFDSQTDGLLQNLGGGAAFNNNGGTFKKSAGTGTTTVQIPFNNAAAVEALSGTLQFTVGYTQTAGSTKLNGGAISSSTTMDIQAGTYTGFGSTTGSITSTSAHAVPGLPIGTLNIAGNYTQSATGSFDVDLGGLTAGTQYDQVSLTGTGAATLAGTLNVSLANGFTPVSGNSFTILSYVSHTGSFSTLNTPPLAQGCWLATYNPTALVLQVITAAVEVTGVGVGADKSTLSWSALPPQPGPAATYDLMRGLTSQFPVGGQPGETCLVSGTTSTSFSDATIPAAGTGFYYLVRGTNACGKGDYGTRTGGLPRNVTVCP